MVLTGHFFKEYNLLWVPVAVGLLIFSFSSGYFTSIKYNGNYSKKEFWKKKFERLGISLLVINLVLLIIFLIQGRSGIMTWHSLVNVIGLNGVFSWFKISNQSPFGAGMWFFTLLLIFYLFYPLIERMKQTTLSLFTIIFICIAYYLNRHVHLGYALWLTSCGFIIGVWAEKTDEKISSMVCWTIAIIILFIMFLTNFLYDLKSLNFICILTFSLALIGAVKDFKVPDIINQFSLFFSGCLLEIYLLHGYLFVTPTANRLINLMVSVGLIIFVSKLVSSVSFKLNKKIVKADI
jgi:hypothetical protein